jgi:hypothetical protein
MTAAGVYGRFGVLSRVELERFFHLDDEVSMSEVVCMDFRSPLHMFGSRGANVGSLRDVSWLTWFFV